MSSASPPPPLPISTTQAAAAQQQPSAPPIATPALRLFLSRLSESARRSLANRRPWHELLDRSAITRPDSLAEALARVRKNLSYFRVNYAVIVSLCLALSLVTHPFSLALLLALLAAWCLLYLFRPAEPPLVILGRTFSDRETLGALILLTVLVVFLSSVGSLLMSALTVGAGIVCLHGAFRVPEDLFLDDQDPAGPASGFLSFLGGGASSAAGLARV